MPYWKQEGKKFKLIHSEKDKEEREQLKKIDLENAGVKELRDVVKIVLKHLKLDKDLP